MRSPWFGDGPAALDRMGIERLTTDVAGVDAVLATSGAVGMRGGRLAFLRPDQRPDGVVAILLGRIEGRIVVAVPAPPDATDVFGVELIPLRDAVEALSEAEDTAGDREIAVTAVAMIGWHERHVACSRCGAPTTPAEAGWVRRCPSGHDDFPRTDPAVIVAITDEDDRLLLAHVAYHSPRRYSHLAGYVEPGESLEQAAHREVGEEASLRLSDLTYVGSQPWPFPASIMVAFRARARAGDLKIDLTEVTDAMWLTREQLAERVADGSVRLAPPGSIARRLIHEWYGADVADFLDVGRV